jgi:hypothetical protein
MQAKAAWATKDPAHKQHEGIAMKISTGPITSASNLIPVALATALLIFGIVMCAVAASPNLVQSTGIAP